MRCGHCGSAADGSAALFLHWKSTGCHRGRPVWARVIEARRRGSSGRRILHEAYPDLYPSRPMDEDTKEKLREIEELRKAAGVKRPVRRAAHARRA
jgi:hypothetical protein